MPAMRGSRAGQRGTEMLNVAEYGEEEERRQHRAGQLIERCLLRLLARPSQGVVRDNSTTWQSPPW